MRRRGRRPGQAGETLVAGTVKVGSSGRAAAFLQNELFVDLIACLLSASGLTMALTTLTVFESGLWRTLILTVVSLAIIALLRIRWWLAPAAAGTLLAATAAYLLVTHNLRRWAEYWTGFLRWTRYGAPADGFYSESGGPLLLEAALAFVVVLAVFALVRRLFAFPLMLGVTAAVMIWVYALKRPDLSIPLQFAVAGLIVLLPRMYARYVWRNSEGVHSRGSMQLVAVPAALLALLLAGVFVPEDTGGWRSRGLNNLVSDVGQLLGGPFQTYPAYASNFSMAMVNFQPDIEHLGGPITPGDAPVALVNTEQPALLRGEVKDYYTGESWWMGAPDGDFRFNSLFWRKYRRETYDLDNPAGVDAGRLFDSLTRKVRIGLQYADNRFSALFAAGRVRKIDFTDRGDMDAYFNARGELYLHARIPGRTRVTIETTLWQPRTPDFDERFLRLEQLTASVPDQKYDQLFGRYTQLPDTLPDVVRAMADDITAGLESPYEKARAIEAWLAENCSYTLKPEAVPNGVDFVAYFLETREGYCVYYASAMAVMARCAGLPSRYVTGFALECDPGVGDGYLATEGTAHAWVEIYFRGIGWMEFDPLAWDTENPLNADAELERPPESEAAVPILPGQSEAKGADGSTFIQNDNTADVNRASIFVSALSFLSAAMLYVLLKVTLRAIMTSKTRAFQLNRVLRRCPDMSSCMEHYYADILRQLRLLGLEPLPGETLNTFPLRVDRRIRLEDGTLTEIAEVRMRMHFAGVEPNQAEVEAVSRYHRRLELYLRERLNKTAYFFRRAVKKTKAAIADHHKS